MSRISIGYLCKVLAISLLIASVSFNLFDPLKPLWIVSLGFIGDVLISTVVAIEIYLATALSLNVAPRAHCLLAIVCFGVFSLYSVIAWTRSAQSCGCFGRLVVSPLLMAVIDISICVGFVFSLRAGKNAPRHRRSPILYIPAPALGVMAFVAASFIQSHLFASNLSADYDHIDLGILTEQESINIAHRFVLTNRTGGTVEISGVDHTCACTTATVSEKFVRPGMTTAVNVSINWSDRRGGQMAGIFVRTKNPVGVLNLVVSGIVDPGIGISPSVLNLGLIESAQIIERPVLLGRTDQPATNSKPLVVNSADSDTVGIAAVPIIGSSRVEGAVWYNIRIDPQKLPEDNTLGHVKFTAADASIKPAFLIVRWTRASEVEPLTPSLRFRDGEATQVARFKFHGSEKPEFDIEGDSGDQAALFTVGKISQTDAGEDVEVNLQPGASNGPIYRRLVAKSGGKEIASVSLVRF